MNSTRFALRRHRGGLGETFSADQVVGKSLTAKRDVELKTGGYDASPVSVVIKAGQPVGVVTSYLQPASGRSSLYWELNVNGRTYYVRHQVGAFDVGNLVVQGSKTTEEKFQEEKEKERKENDPIVYYFKKLAVPVLLGGGAIWAGVQIVKTFILKPSKT